MSSKISDEQINQLVEESSHKMQEWIKFDQFVLEQTDYLVERMDEMNRSLSKTVEKLLYDRVHVDSAKKSISDIFKLSMDNQDFEGVQKLMKTLGGKKGLDNDINSLVGMVHYNILLAKRFSSFRTVIQMLDILYMNPNDPEKIKEKFKLYGLNLQYIWKHCYSQCHSMAEREIFQKALANRPQENNVTTDLKKSA